MIHVGGIILTIFIWCLVFIGCFMLLGFIFKILEQLGLKRGGKIIDIRLLSIIEKGILLLAGCFVILVTVGGAIGHDIQIVLMVLIVSWEIYLFSMLAALRSRYLDASSLLNKGFKEKFKQDIFYKVMNRACQSKVMRCLPSFFAAVFLQVLILTTVPALVKKFNWMYEIYFVQIVAVPIISTIWVYFETGDILSVTCKGNDSLKKNIRLEFHINPERSIVKLKRMWMYAIYLIFNIFKSYNQFLDYFQALPKKNQFIEIAFGCMFVIFLSLDRVLKEIYDMYAVQRQLDKKLNEDKLTH